MSSGVGIVVALSVLLFESWRMESRLQNARHEQALAIAERLLQRAPGSFEAFVRVPEARRARVQRGGAIDVDEVGWLEVAPSPLDRDLVVEDRLLRAARAEFGDGDPAQARQQHDELLAARLPTSQRLLVVHAAAWHAARAGDESRLTTLRDELDRAVAALAPADLARPAMARVLGGTLRLPRAAAAPSAVSELAPFLPPEVFAALPAAARTTERHAAIAERRAFLRAVDAVWRACADGRALTSSGLVAADAQQLLWWFTADDGTTDVALLPPAEFCAAVTAASLAGELAELPAPYALDPADSTRTSFDGVPGVRGITQLGSSAPPAWLGPLLSGSLLVLLLLAFVLALVFQLRGARREVEAARLQTQFLTTVTHELKTPLAGIHLLGEMLAEGRAQGREGLYYRLLVGEAGRLAMLIDNVLDLGRLERGERGVEPKPVDVGDAVSETLAMFTPLAERDGMTIVARGTDTGLVATMDRAAFVQALVAVLDNARKYGAAGGVLEVDCGRAGANVQVTVRDRGPGVPEAERERVFERFVRGSAHRHGSTPGVGIGLFLARSLMRRQGGELRLAPTSDGGPGAAFVFQLPVEDAA